eukprot:scpid99289/ scgid7012/ 
MITSSSIHTGSWNLPADLSWSKIAFCWEPHETAVLKRCLLSGWMHRFCLPLCCLAKVRARADHSFEPSSTSSSQTTETKRPAMFNGIIPITNTQYTGSSITPDSLGLQKDKNQDHAPGSC